MFGVEPGKLDVRPAFDAGVLGGFDHGEIGVVQLGVFSDDADADRVFFRSAPVYHRLPLAEVGLRRIDAELAAHDVGKPLALEHEGRLVEVGQREVLDHAVSLDVAEQGYLAEYPFIEGAVAAQDDDVGADA